MYCLRTLSEMSCQFGMTFGSGPIKPITRSEVISMQYMLKNKWWTEDYLPDRWLVSKCYSQCDFTVKPDRSQGHKVWRCCLVLWVNWTAVNPADEPARLKSGPLSTNKQSHTHTDTVWITTPNNTSHKHYSTCTHSLHPGFKKQLLRKQLNKADGGHEMIDASKDRKGSYR